MARMRFTVRDIAEILEHWQVGNTFLNLLTKSSITEQRSFLKSFVERIDVDDVEVKVHYTMPMPPYNVAEGTVGVLPFVHHG